MFPYVSHWKTRGYRGIHLIIRTKDAAAFALLKKTLNFFLFVFNILPLIDILETNMLNVPVLNIVTIVIFLSMPKVKS